MSGFDNYLGVYIAVLLVGDTDQRKKKLRWPSFFVIFKIDLLPSSDWRLAQAQASIKTESPLSGAPAIHTGDTPHYLRSALLVHFLQDQA